MSLTERRQRWRQDHDLLREAGSSTWSRNFLADLTAERVDGLVAPRPRR